MGAFAYPHNFTAGTVADPTQVMANLEAARTFMGGSGAGGSLGVGNVGEPYVHWALPAGQQLVNLALAGVDLWRDLLTFRAGAVGVFLKALQFFTAGIGAGAGTVQLDSSADGAVWVTLVSGAITAGFPPVQLTANVSLPANYYVRVRVVAGGGGLTLAAPYSAHILCRSTISSVT